MSQKYNRKNLAFFLADLGEELGRVPKPSDLKKGMPSRSTFKRYFKDWAEALEYAGYMHDVVKDSEKVPILQQSEIKIINLLGQPVIIVGPDGESEVFEPVGTAKIVRSMPKTPSIAKVLAPYLAGHIVKSSQLKRICVDSLNGTSHEFPAYQDGVFYIVPEVVARNIYRGSRTSMDLLYPRVRESHYQGGILYVGDLQMVYVNRMPIDYNA